MSALFIRLLAFGGQHNDGNMRGHRIVTQGLRHVDAIEARHHPVQDQEVWVLLSRELQGSSAIGGFDNAIFGIIQGRADEYPQIGFVIGKQKSFQGVSFLGTPRPIVPQAWSMSRARTLCPCCILTRCADWAGLEININN